MRVDSTLIYNVHYVAKLCLIQLAVLIVDAPFEDTFNWMRALWITMSTSFASLMLFLEVIAALFTSTSSCWLWEWYLWLSHCRCWCCWCCWWCWCCWCMALSHYQVDIGLFVSNEVILRVCILNELTWQI